MTSAIRALSPAVGSATSGFRYLFLPPAGGTVGMFRDVVEAASGTEVWGVEYPGRGNRVDAPPPATLEALAEQITHELLVRFGPGHVERTVLAGFSMGAFVALEMAQRVHVWCGAAPAAVIVVGAPAPGRRIPGQYARIVDEEPPGTLTREGFVPGAGNRASFEAWAYAMELLRGDLRLTTAYPGPARIAVPCPLAALCGEDDPGIAAADATHAWRTWATGNFLAATVPGGHIGLLDPGRGAEFWTWARRIEQAVLAQGTCDA